MLKSNLVYIILLLIILFAAFIRFYRLPEMANYDFDQEYASNFAFSVLKEFPIQLIGQGLSVEGLFMGPWYFYYLVPFFALSNLHPIGGFVGSVIFGLIIILTYFFVAKSMFNFKAGLIAAFLRSILFLELEHDWSMVPAFASELLVLATWFLFYKYWHGQTKALVWLGFVFGLFTSIHPILFPFYIVFLILVLVKRKLPSIKLSMLSIGAFIIPILPLLIFEYLRNFFELKVLTQLFFGPKQQSNGLEKLSLFFQFNLQELQRMLGSGFIPKEIFYILLLTVLLWLVIKKIAIWKNTFHTTVLIVTYIVFIGYYTLYPANVPQYYFIALSTLALLYLSNILSIFTKNKITFFLLIIILINIAVVNLQMIKAKLDNPSLITLYHKDFIVKEILKIQPQGQQFYVSYIKLPGWNFGFNYLFKNYDQIPQTKEAKPPVYTIVIPKNLSIDSIDIASGNVGLILPE